MSIDIYLQRKKVLANLIATSIITLAMFSFVCILMSLVVTGVRKGDSRALGVLAPVVLFGFAATIGAFFSMRYWYLYTNKGPYVHANDAGITIATGPHRVHIPWSNVAHMSLGAYAAGRYGYQYRHAILIHLLDTSKLNKKACFWNTMSPFSKLEYIRIENITDMPLNQLFVALEKYRKH